MKIKFNNMIVKVILILSIFLMLSVSLERLLYKDRTKAISIANESIYVIRHRVPIDLIRNYERLIGFLLIDYRVIYQSSSILEKIDLNSSKRLESKNNPLSILGYFKSGHIIDKKSDPEVINILSLESNMVSKYQLKDREDILYDSKNDLFYAKFGKKFFKLKSENDMFSFEVPIEPFYDACGVDSGMLFICVQNAEEYHLKECQIYDITKNTIKGVDLNSEWIILGFKDLKLIGHKFGSGDYSLIELIANNDVFEIKSIKALHKSKGSFDDFNWDKKNNKIYFYDAGRALFLDTFDVYQYDDNTLSQKIFHVNLKR